MWSVYASQVCTQTYPDTILYSQPALYQCVHRYFFIEQVTPPSTSISGRTKEHCILDVDETDKEWKLVYAVYRLPSVRPKYVSNIVNPQTGNVLVHVVYTYYPS